MKDSIKDYENDFYLLLEGGFLAVNAGDEDSATKLFKASQLLKPDNTFPLLGFGYMHFCKLELQRAVEIFKEIGKKEPSNEVATMLLGMSMSMIPNMSAEGSKILDSASKNTKNDDIKNLGSSTNEFLDKFIRKQNKPMDLHKKEKGK